MKVFVSTSAEITQQTLKRKLKIGAVLQLTAVVKPDVVGTLGRGKTSVNLAHTYTVTDIEMTKSGDIKKCTLSVKGAVPSPVSGLKSVEVLTAAALIKLLSTKINKDSKIGTKTLKFVVSEPKASTPSTSLKFQSFDLKTVSVVGGWRLAIVGKRDTDQLLVGPVFRSTEEAWNWQKKNLTKKASK